MRTIFFTSQQFTHVYNSSWIIPRGWIVVEWPRVELPKVWFYDLCCARSFTVMFSFSYIYIDSMNWQYYEIKLDVLGEGGRAPYNLPNLSIEDSNSNLYFERGSMADPGILPVRTRGCRAWDPLVVITTMVMQYDRMHGILCPFTLETISKAEGVEPDGRRRGYPCWGDPQDACPWPLANQGWRMWFGCPESHRTWCVWRSNNALEHGKLPDIYNPYMYITHSAPDHQST